MTTTTERIDVNAGFAAKQLASFEARVANGSLVDLGNGRYQSTEGWDRGEVWTLRQSSTADRQMLVMPEHGLDIDEVTGRAKLFSAVPAWHGLGQVIPGGITSIDDVIRLGIGAEHYGMIWTGLHAVPGQFAIFNGTSGEFWGMVGKVHKNIDVRASFEFMENLAGEGVVWESAGLMGSGRRVFISAKQGIQKHFDLAGRG